MPVINAWLYQEGTEAASVCCALYCKLDLSRYHLQLRSVLVVGWIKLVGLPFNTVDTSSERVGCKQANMLSRLLKPLYLEIKLKESTLKCC